MTISMRRLAVLSGFKVRELLKNKTFLISVIMVPGITLVMRLIYQNMMETDIPSSIFSYVLKLGVLYNLNMISILMPATILAKDKEKNTLRTLMTSSVNGGEYFIGVILPTFLVSALVNVLVLMISGIPMDTVNLPLYFIVGSLASLISCVIGMVIGILSKNQMSSSNLANVVILFLLMVPMFSGMLPQLSFFNKILYTGIVGDMISGFTQETGYQMTVLSWGILAASAVFSIGAFVILYRKNGFDAE